MISIPLSLATYLLPYQLDSIWKTRIILLHFATSLNKDKPKTAF